MGICLDSSLPSIITTTEPEIYRLSKCSSAEPMHLDLNVGKFYKSFKCRSMPLRLLNAGPAL